MKLASCKSCGAPIVWVLTANSKNMPIDADPVRATSGFRVDDEDAERPLATWTNHPAPDEKLHQSHFATCPTATQHRRP